MHWILQDNLINADTRNRIKGLLNERGTAYSCVTLIPIFNQLEGSVPRVEGPVFVYGSTGLGHVAKDQGWRPGYYDANLDYERMLANYGELALNEAAQSGTLGDIAPTFDHFFVRPVLDNKSFPGTVMTRDGFEQFRAGVRNVSEDADVTLRVSDRIVIAPLTDITAEYRFFVVAGKVVTGSRYKSGDYASSSADVPEELAQFAQSCADRWQPNDAFSLDVAVTPRGFKAIELNSANSAGFYQCDIGAIIDAVNRLS
jgi:hypothetical protein